MCVCDVVTATGCWNFAWLLTVLPRDVVVCVSACSSPREEMGANQLS